jgi:hypothetical protein
LQLEINLLHHVARFTVAPVQNQSGANDETHATKKTGNRFHFKKQNPCSAIFKGSPTLDRPKETKSIANEQAIGSSNKHTTRIQLRRCSARTRVTKTGRHFHSGPTPRNGEDIFALGASAQCFG